MNSFISQLIFFILIHIKSIENYRTGAPPEACATMTPGHTGVSSQQCSTNYIIQSDKSQYYTNDTVRITINGSTSSDTFRGVLLIAKTENSGQILGTWSIVGSNLQTLACDGTANTGVTHNANNDKTSVQAIWTPPSTISTENTIIRATIVKTYNTIYVNCFSVKLINIEANQSSNATTTNTTSNNVSTISTTVATVITTTQASNTGAEIKWTFANGVTSVKMQVNNLQTSQWFALGLSLDDNMGEDHVFVCKRLADDTIEVVRLINPDGRTPPQVATTVLSDPGGTFSATLRKLENGIVYCEFTLSNFDNSKRRRRAVSGLSQTQPYTPLIAMGNLNSQGGLTQHTTRTALSQTVRLNRDETIIYNGDLSGTRMGLMKAHGIIMIFSWIFFASTGILIARYFKPAWPGKKICGKAIWFAIHRGTMMTVVVLTIIAFILILVYKKGEWVLRTNRREFAHSIIGIIIISFAIIQPIMTLFRCKPDAKYRFIFNYAHAFVGLSAFTLSIVALFLSMFFTQFNFDINKEWGILVAWACWIPVIFFSFWLIDLYYRRYGDKEKENIDSYDLGNTSQPKTESEQKTRNQIKLDRIKLTFLIIHIFVALGLALALAIIVGKT